MTKLFCMRCLLFGAVRCPLGFPLYETLLAFDWGSSPVLIKQRYGYQEFHSQPEHWKLVGF
ncbi:hypothetical protein, partial [Nostoc sp.]